MNNISKMIKSRETVGFHFKPTREFYKAIGIKQKRFNMLLRNERSATIDELQAIASFLNVNLTDLIN